MQPLFRFVVVFLSFLLRLLPVRPIKRAKRPSPKALVASLLSLLLVAQPTSFCWAASSVNAQLGIFSYDHIDLTTGGIDPVVIYRHYQNAKNDGFTPTVQGPFSWGTTLGLYSYIVYDYTLPGGLSVLTLTGEQTDFHCNNGTCTNDDSKAALRGTFTISGSTDTLTLEDGTKLNFATAATTQGQKHLSSIKDRYGKVTTLTWSGDNLTKIENPLGRGIQLTYSNNRISTAQLYDTHNANVLAHSYTVSYDYDYTGNLVGYHDLNGNTTNYGYYVGTNGIESDWMNSIKDARFNTVLTNIYTSGPSHGPIRVSQQRMPGTNGSDSSDDILVNYGINTQYSKATVQTFGASSGAGPVLTYYYNATNNYINQINNSADNSSTYYTYDDTSGLVNSVKYNINSTDYTTYYNYQTAGAFYHLSSIAEPNGFSFTSFNFSGPFGQLYSLEDANSHTTYFTYNSATATTAPGALIQVATPLPASLNYNPYNDFGQVLTFTDGAGRETKYTYNSTTHDLTDVLGPDGLTRHFVYDELSRITSVYLTNVSGDSTNYTYDHGGRVKQITRQPGNQTTQFEYDGDDNITKVTAPNGVTTQYQYDAMGRRTSRQQGSYTEYYYYNSLGQLDHTVDPKNQTTRYGYDSKQRLHTLTYNDGTIVTYNYDTLDRVTSVTDSSDSSHSKDVSFTYNNDNGNIPGPLTVTTGAGSSAPDTLSYSYDSAGNLTAVSRGSTQLLTYDYWPDNSLHQAFLKGQSGAPDMNVAIGYNDANQQTVLNYHDGSGILYGNYYYNPQGDLSEIRFTNNLSPSALIREVVYGYNYSHKGELTQRTLTGQKLSANSLSYTYDHYGQVISTLVNTSTGSQAYNQTWDSDGNITSENQGSVTYQLGTNRLDTYANRAVTNDNNGNITTQKCSSSCTAVNETYTWNARNQLIKYENTVNNGSESFVYDALGRRIQETVDGVTTKFVYAGSQVIEEITNGVTKRYLVGPSLDDVWGSRTDSTDEFLIHDPLNNSVLVVVDAKTLQAKFGIEYTGFGLAIGSSQADKNTTDNRLYFMGRELSKNTVQNVVQLYYFRGRYYNPDLHRFISEDPIGFSSGNTNLYVLNFNNPTVGTDPIGAYEEGNPDDGNTPDSSPVPAPSPIPKLFGGVSTDPETEGPKPPPPFITNGGGNLIAGGGSPSQQLPRNIERTGPNEVTITRSYADDLVLPLYHRFEAEFQSKETAAKQVASQEIWGRVPRGGFVPTVQAYFGALPPGERGVEFTTPISPENTGVRMVPGVQVRWYGNITPGVPIKEVDGDEFAILRVIILRNTQM